MARLPGETLYSGVTPAQRAAKKLTEEYNQLNDATTRREEWMAVSAIVNGKIAVVGDGVNEEIDFGFTNKVTLTGTSRWGQSAGDPLKNLDEWKRQTLINGFSNVDTVIMGKEALEKFLDDTKVQKMLDNRRIEMGLIQPKDLPNGVSYVGHLNKPDVDIYEYTEVYLDDWTDPSDPQTKPLIPSNAVVMISSNANFVMAYGACTYIEDSTQQWVTAESARVLRSYVEHHPDRRMIELQAHPLPIPDKADSWFVATVL